MIFNNGFGRGWISFLSKVVIMNIYMSMKEPTMNRKLETPPHEFDFIVVGGGSAGSVVAARLSEIKEFRVLLLEAGGDETTSTTIPWFHTQLPGSKLDWKYKTLPQEGILLGYENQESRWPRGKVIGGTSSINTMIYMRGNKKDYDNWESYGNVGWSYLDVLPYFKKAQHQTDPILASDSFHHGVGGPLTIESSTQGSKLFHAFLEAGKFLGFPIGDPNGSLQSVFSPFQMTINKGVRWSTSRAYLRPVMSRENLFVSLHSRVTKVITSPDTLRAMGVEFVKDGQKRRAFCKKEVILSAGAIGSPQLLMLSGIGPKDHLEEMGIPVVSDLPVGENLQDHLGVFGLSWTAQKGVGYSLAPLANPFTIKEYKLHHKGFLASTAGVEGNAYLSTKYSNWTYDWPDIQMLFVSATPVIDGGHTFVNYLGVSREMLHTYYKNLRFREGFSIVPILLRPYSRGYIKLKSSDPLDHPIIQPNYLRDSRDTEILIEGIKLALKIGNSIPFKKYGTKFHLAKLPRCPTVDPLTDEYWDCFIRHNAQTEHHIAGSCKMGTVDDPESVVDPELRIFGVKGLRVVDGSIMPFVISGNTNSAIIMIGEKASDMIKDTWLIKDTSRKDSSLRYFLKYMSIYVPPITQG